MKIKYWFTKWDWWQFCIDDTKRFVTIYSRWYMWDKPEVIKIAKMIKKSFLLREYEEQSTRKAREFIYNEFWL